VDKRATVRASHVPLSFLTLFLFWVQKTTQQQQLSLLSQASWSRREMKPTENKNKKHKKRTNQKKELEIKQKVIKITV
jgi:hypothetical protein